jgi:uncharacterized membrane protein YcaP (DUF421 family)
MKQKEILDMDIYFSDWERLAGVALSAVLTYIGVIFLLRVSGKRTLSKMNAFDFTMTVALGSMIASTVLSKSTKVADGLVGIGTLILLQLALTFVTTRSKTFKNLITSEPKFLVYKGEIRHKTLKRERISEEELHTAARKKEISSFDEIDYIVLETTGYVNIIKKLDAPSPESAKMLEGVKM